MEIVFLQTQSNYLTTYGLISSRVISNYNIFFYAMTADIKHLITCITVVSYSNLASWHLLTSHRTIFSNHEDGMSNFSTKKKHNLIMRIFFLFGFRQIHNPRSNSMSKNKRIKEGGEKRRKGRRNKEADVACRRVATLKKKGKMTHQSLTLC